MYTHIDTHALRGRECRADGGGRRNGTVYLLRLPEKTRAGQVDACTRTHDARRKDTHENGEPTRIYLHRCDTYNINTYVDVDVGAYIYIHTLIQKRCLHTHTHTHLHMHTYIYAFIHTCMHALLYAFRHTCMHA
jgi:hypothetical protein